MHNISKFFISRIKKKLIIGFSNKSGKNFLGRKTIFTQSGGLKFKNRIIDFKRFIGPLSVLLSVEKDINRTAYVGLVFYNIGIFCYIILPSIKFEIGNLFPGFINFFKKDSSTFLFNIPNGTFIHNIELMVGMGGKISRAAGSSSFIISKDKLFVNLKMHSGWLLKLSKYCISVIGRVSNESNYLYNKLNAGKNRKLGFRPIVRGVAMNPCDHAHGGGEGRSSPPVAHKTFKGKLTKIPTKKNIQFKKKKKLFKIFKNKNK